MPIHWHKTLALRLAVMINLVAAGVLGSFWAFDARRERQTHLKSAAAGLILGVAETTGATVRVARLDPQQRLYLFTDGLLEASAADGTHFGADRLGELLAAFEDGPDARAAHLSRVIEHVRAFTGRERFDDDVTLVEIRRAADAGAG